MTGEFDADRLWVVGIGSSAGGIEALREMLPGLSDGPVAYVIAQHMSPVHPSLLLQVLSRETPLEVREISDGTALRSGCVFVAPPNCDVEVVDSTFVTRQAEPRISPQPSIDVLLRSIAEDAGGRAIGVILSGTGSDGAQGCEAIREVGGRTVAQDPQTARYRDMPGAAIDGGAIEFVRAPSDVGTLLGQLMAGEQPAGAGGRFADDPTMAALAREARRVTGWDLAAYKEGTLGRQIERRIGSLGLTDLADYLRFTHEHPGELAELRDSMLINVTSFLRDRAAFDTLRHSLERVVAAKPSDEPLRAWVAGCATGEEAYSIAMLLSEVNRATGGERPIKVFATDISEAAMEVARRGSYPLSALADVPPEWIERYFALEGERAVVVKDLRDTLVIARQDITRDPPLVRMDLVSCRNLLIYLVSPVQERVVANLHAALNPRGLLFLGRSESIPGDELFSTISAGNRIFQRRPGPAIAAYLAPRPDPRPVRTVSTARIPRDRLRDDVRDVILGEFGPPALLVDSSGLPIHQIGDVGRYLVMPAADGDFTLTSMIRPDLRTEVATIMARLGRDGLTAASHPVLLRDASGAARSITIQARRITPGAAQEPFVLLAFVPAPPPVVADPGATEGSGGMPDNDIEALRSQLAATESELIGTREHLQAVVEELESSNEELQAMNEELQASSEELQATNEELETTNEELQATNEELTTVNETLEVRTAELVDTNEVLRTIQESVHTAVVLVDRDQRVMQFSPLAVRVFGLARNDIGSRLAGVPSHVNLPDLSERVDQVMASGESQVLDVDSSTSSYVLQVLPYVRRDAIVGAILALSDITDLARSRREAERHRSLVAGVFEMSGTPMAWLDESGRVAQVNSDLLEALGGNDVRGVHLVDLVDNTARTDVLELLDAVSRDPSRPVRGTVALQDRANGADSMIVDLTLAIPGGQTGSGASILATLHDVTEAVRAASQIKAQQRQLDAVFVATGAPMLILDATGRVIRENPAVARVLGFGTGGLVGRTLSDVVHPDDDSIDQTMMADVVSGERESYEAELRFVTASGLTIWGRLSVARAPSLEDTDLGLLIATLLDVTVERERELSALQRAQTDPLTGLTNRPAAFERLAHEVARSQRLGEAVSVVVVDINGFRGVNDRFGHEAGDDVLIEIAARMRRVARPADTVARLGADEFLIVAPHERGEPATEGVHLAGHVVAAVREPIGIESGERSVVVTASAGVASCPTDGFDVEELVRRADVAMYSAKQAGGDSYAAYSTHLSSQARRVAAMRGEVLDALSSGHFVPYFQPIVSASDGKPVALEALARWLHPERGVLGPADFLDLIADYHQWESFTTAMAQGIADMRRACRAAGHDVSVSLNLDPIQMHEHDLVSLLEEISGGDLTGWTMEVTEAGAYGDEAVVRRCLANLRSLGARASLDDFGTGYSSLVHLKGWGFDEVKIDRAFIVDVEKADARALVATMVAMAGLLGAHTVAEGVETAHQASILGELGVDLLQGFHFARPMPASDALEWLVQALR